MAEEQLRDKTIKGVGWSAIDNVLSLAVSFIVSIILARLLSPEDYGLIGIISVFIAICSTFANAGFGSAIIRKKDPSEDDYNTVFIFNLVISIALYLLLFFCAPFISSFFEREELTSLIQVSSIIIIIRAIALTQRLKLTKKIDFKTQTKISIISAISSGLLGIISAVIGMGVWALVVQLVSMAAISSICLWLFNKWIPRLYFSKKSFNELFGFGWKMLLADLLNRLWKELNQIIIGKFFSPATLGQYTRSAQFARLFSSNLTEVVQRVTYPALSEMQDNTQRMVTAYRKMIKVTMFVSCIAMFSLGAVSEPLLYCLIGPKWHEAAIYLPFICISMSLYPLHAINLNMLAVQGRSDILLVLEIVKKIIGVTPLIVCVFWGIISMLIVGIFTNIICFFLNSYYTGRDLGYTSWMQIKDVIPSYSIASLIALSVYFLKFIPISPFIILPLQVIIGFIIGIIICERSKHEEYQEVKAIAKSIIEKFFRK